MCRQYEAEIGQLEREIRIGLRTDSTRLDEIHAQYETTQAELQALDEARRQQQTLVQEIIALRKGLLEETEADTPEAESEVSPAERLAQLSAELDALHNMQLLVSPHVDKNRSLR